MTNVARWRSAFKEIYGRTPTKSDYNLAPQHVKEVYVAECPQSLSVAEGLPPPRRGEVRLKRPNLDAEENSPVKRRSVKARRLCNIQGSRTSPRKSLATPSRCSNLSPVKSTNSSKFPWPNRAVVPVPLKDIQSASGNVPLLSQPPAKRLAGIPAFSSLFDTPEKGQMAAWGEISPKKAFVPPSVGTPIRSPRKPFVHKEVLIRNVECLLLPTPEKREPKVLEPFQPEEVAIKKTAAGAKRDMAVAFSAEQGKVIKRAFKRSIPGTVRPKKEKGNFVRINMKKKSYTKGKVSAEQKRKMRRKQNWKKRMGGNGGR